MVSGIRSQKFIDSDFGEIHRALGLASGQISQCKFRGINVLFSKSWTWTNQEQSIRFKSKPRILPTVVRQYLISLKIWAINKTLPEKDSN